MGALAFFIILGGIFYAGGILIQALMRGWEGLRDSFDEMARYRRHHRKKPEIRELDSENSGKYGQIQKEASKQGSGGMTTVSFRQGKCDICGKEFISMQNDAVIPLQEVEWSIANGPKIKKNFCNECLSDFISSTSANNKRAGEAEATESARKYMRFFRK